MMKSKEEKQYVLIKNDGSVVLIQNEAALVRSVNSNLTTVADRYYELGNEVTVETTIIVKPKNPVYRSALQE